MRKSRVQPIRLKTIRVPEDLARLLAKAAKAAKKSENAYVVDVLRKELDK